MKSTFGSPVTDLMNEASPKDAPSVGCQGSCLETTMETRHCTSFSASVNDQCVSPPVLHTVLNHTLRNCSCSTRWISRVLHVISVEFSLARGFFFFTLWQLGAVKQTSCSVMKCCRYPVWLRFPNEVTGVRRFLPYTLPKTKLDFLQIKSSTLPPSVVNLR